MRPFLSLLIAAVCWLAVCGACPAAGGDTPARTAPGAVILEPGRDSYRMQGRLEILEDPDGELTIEDVTRPPWRARFVDVPGGSPSRGFSDSVWWVRFTLKDRSVREDWLLEVAYPLLDSVEFHQPLPGRGYTGFATGDTEPFGDRPYLNRNFVFPVDTFLEARDYYLRVETDSSVIIPVRLWAKDAFASRVAAEQMVLGLYYGVLGVMLAYNFFIFLSLRDRSYLYYVFYIAAYGLFQGGLNGLTYEYLWPDSPDWNQVAMPLFMGLATFAALVFTRAFLDMRRLFPRMSKWFVVLMAAAGVQAALSLVAPYHLSITTGLNLALVVILSIFAAAIRGVARGLKHARFFITAWFVFLAGMLVSILNKGYGLAPSNFWTLYGFQIGSALEVVLLSLALADRINVTQEEKERARAQRVLALKRTDELNEELKEANRGLEEKVAERTRDLREANEKLVRLDRLKSDFLANVSHELRTPLTSVVGFAQIIQERFSLSLVPKLPAGDAEAGRVAEKIANHMDIIVSEGERLTRMINEVLDLAKMEAGKVDWHMQRLDMGQVVEQAAGAVESLFTAKGLEFSVTHDPGLPQVMGDRDRLVQVCINMLSNAVKFTESGSVAIRARASGSGVEVSVTDTGPGIPAQDLDKVFDKFKQVGDTLTDKPRGTGLGLPICKQIVDQHGGTVWVDSRENRGSTFAFFLPAAADADAFVERIADMDELAARLRRHLDRPGKEGERKQILVVDDDPMIRALLRDHLEERGYGVMEAGDGVQALELVAESKPDCITLDVMMPRMSGFDAATTLRNDPLTADIPLVMLSIVEDRARGYRIGVDRFFTKPIDTKRLLEEIDLLTTSGTGSRKIMVVDASPEAVANLTGVLADQGYQVVSAHDREECLDMAVAEQPDMVIIGALFSGREDIISTLRHEKGLANLFFIVLGEDDREPDHGR
jgi:signal transduction histidine kinase/CheY-like chemotaxis protein